MQLALAYDASHVGAALWARKLAWLRRAVDVLGHKEVAFKLDVAPSNLTDALLERERKDVKAKWFDVVLAMPLPAEMKAEYVRMTCDALGYEMPERRRTKTAEEELRELRQLLKANAPVVLALVDKEMGR
jgi:hypothetical protein